MRDESGRSFFLAEITLKWYSSPTRNGKDIACRMRFSFNVCSTCFSFTTWKRHQEKKDTISFVLNTDKAIEKNIILWEFFAINTRRRRPWAWMSSKIASWEYRRGDMRAQPRTYLSNFWNSEIRNFRMVAKIPKQPSSSCTKSQLTNVQIRSVFCLLGEDQTPACNVWDSSNLFFF